MLSTKASVGLFLCAGTVLFGAGLFLLGDQKKLFTRSFEVRSDFESVAGLEKGANVRVAGLNAGEVKTIEVLPQKEAEAKRFRLHLRVDRKLQKMVDLDSIAVIETEGLVGNKYLEIQPGDELGAQCGDPCQISSQETFDFSDLMQEARGLLSNTDSTIQTAGEVGENINRVLGRFLARDANGKTGADNLTATTANAQAAFSNLADSTEALKHNFFLRGFFNKRGFFNLGDMSVTDYLSSDFVTKKRAKRVWVEAASIFTSAKSGEEELSPAGRSKLDEAVAAFASELANSPLVIEAYALEGSPDARFRRAQRRGLLVQTYLQQRFQLKPKYVGAIALVDSPPKQTGKTTWDGVSLVLLPQR